MITIEFTVPGKPVGKQRPRITKYNGSYTPKQTREYEAAVEAEFVRAMLSRRADGLCFDPKLVRCAEVYITAFFGVPASWPSARRSGAFDTPYRGKPDADNIAKIICDALNGLAYPDDSCVTELDVSKRYCGRDDMPCVEVTVALDFIERMDRK